MPPLSFLGMMGRSESREVDCLPKTQVYANSKEEVYGLKPDRCQKINEAGSFPSGKGLATEVLVNVSSNYNCSKVAKFLVA